MSNQYGNRVMYKLDIYKVTNNEWELVDTVYGTSADACLDQAEREYGINDGYEWTDPVEA